MKILKDYPMYGYEDGKVWNVKRGKPLRPNASRYVNLRVGNEKRSYSVARVAYCAEKGIELARIPSGTIFVFEDGKPRPASKQEISEKAARTKVEHNKMTLERLDANITYLEKLRGYMVGDVEPYEIFEEIEKAGDAVLPIVAARFAITLDSARVFVDEAVMECFDKIVHGTFIGSPYRYVSRVASLLKKPRYGFKRKEIDLEGI